MNKFSWILTLLVTLSGVASALPNATETVAAKGGAIHVMPIYDASLQIEWRDMVFQIDPSSAGNYTGAKKPDIILITDVAHVDEKAILNLMRRDDKDYGSGCTIYGPKAVVAKLKPLEIEEDFRVKVEVLDSNISSWRDGADEMDYSINAVSSLEKGRVGYVLTLGGKRIYVAGNGKILVNSELLHGIDIAFLPVNSANSFTPQEAAKQARVFKPKMVYPYSYRNDWSKPNANPQQFAQALQGSGIQVKLRGWYDHPARVTKK